MEYNTYISYNETGKVYADCIYSQLLHSSHTHLVGKIRPFYYASETSRPRKTRIKEVIPFTKFLIIILTDDYFNGDLADSDSVKQELLTVAKYPQIDFICICTTEDKTIDDYLNNKIFFDKTFFPEDIKNKLMNPYLFLNYDRINFFDSASTNGIIDCLIKKLPDGENMGRVSLGNILVEEDKLEFSEPAKHTKKPMQMDLPGEAERLVQQQQLLLNFDIDAYERVFKDAPKNILDIGCNTGDAIFNRIKACGYETQFNKIVGIDICRGVIKKAKCDYGNKNVIFEVLDVESEDFPKKLKKIMYDNNIESFDFVNISSVLLQLKNPGKLLLQVNDFLSDTASILIEDVDDALFMAYPDAHGYFATAISICDQCERTGFRQTGRQIYTLLSDKTDCSEITFLKSGLNTSDMNTKQKAAFFDVVFNYIERCVQQECKVKDRSHAMQKATDWLRKHREKMKAEYDRSDFFFSYGYVIYLGKIIK